MPKAIDCSLALISFWISLCVAGCIVGVNVIAGLMSVGEYHGLPEPYQTITKATLILLLAVDSVAAALGLTALLWSKAKRLFGIFGFLFSLATIFATIWFIWLR
jgi:hypothetical protein